MAIFFIRLLVATFCSQPGGLMTADEMRVQFLNVVRFRTAHNLRVKKAMEKRAHEDLSAKAAVRPASDVQVHSEVEYSDQGKSATKRRTRR